MDELSSETSQQLASKNILPLLKIVQNIINVIPTDVEINTDSDIYNYFLHQTNNIITILQSITTKEETVSDLKTNFFVNEVNYVSSLDTSILSISRIYSLLIEFWDDLNRNTYTYRYLYSTIKVLSQEIEKLNTHDVRYALIKAINQNTCLWEK